MELLIALLTVLAFALVPPALTEMAARYMDRHHPHA